jgi:hypothetical protein
MTTAPPSPLQRAACWRKLWSSFVAAPVVPALVRPQRLPDAWPSHVCQARGGTIGDTAEANVTGEATVDVAAATTTTAVHRAGNALGTEEAAPWPRAVAPLCPHPQCRCGGLVTGLRLRPRRRPFTRASTDSSALLRQRRSQPPPGLAPECP